LNEEKHIKVYQVAVITASVILIILLFMGWYVSGPGQEWRKWQNDYLALSDQLPDSVAVQAFSGFRKGILEHRIDGLNAVDRCITCHTGVENPYMENMPPPFAVHPGDMFTHHPPDEYGCTICHGGQGRALTKKDAHGIAKETHWDHPLLSYPYSQSSCGKCHLSVFSENQELAGTDVFRKGQSIFNREGCLGCHKARGVGGIIGPDLTEQGEKTRHEYSFQNIEVEQTVSNWLKEHFRDPEMVSPGSQMLKIDLPEEDLDALTTFVLGLAKPDIDFEYFSLETINEFKGNRSVLGGEKLFGLACAACHGKEGEGKGYEEYKTGVPGIGRRDFIRVASKAYIDFTLQKGRSLRQMASWAEDISGVENAELTDLRDYLHSGLQAHPPFTRLLMQQGDIQSGAELFSNNCATCHGKDGEGGIALAVNRQDFLRYANDEFLYNSLLKGRDDATMPSWEYMQTSELASLVMYLRSFGRYAPRERNVQFAGGDPVDGRLKYRFLCMRCHGEAGQGQTGPSVINGDLLSIASDEYLFNTIAYGRGHTAMFGWSVDVYNAERLGKQEIGNIVAFMREEAEAAPDYIYAGTNPGDRQSGEGLYQKHCADCHGKEGEGENAPALNNQEFLSSASNGYLVASVTVGRDGTEMPAWGYEQEDYPLLTAKERHDIVAWIRSWQRIRIGF